MGIGQVVRDRLKNKFVAPLIKTHDAVPYEYAIFCRDLHDSRWKTHDGELKHVVKQENGEYPKFDKNSKKFGEYHEDAYTTSQSMQDMLQKYEPLHHLQALLEEHHLETLTVRYKPEPAKAKRQGDRWIIFCRLSEKAKEMVLQEMKDAGNLNDIAFNSAERTYFTDLLVADPMKVHIRRFMEVSGHPFVEHFFAIHDRHVNKKLLSSIMKHPFVQFNHLQAIREHFDEKVAFYFAWIDFYNRMLLLPGLVGIFLTIFFYFDKDAYHHILPINGVAILVWGTCFNVMWKLRERELALVWSVDAFGGVERRRFEYLTDVQNTRISPITGQLETYYPQKLRFVQYAISISVFLFQTVILIALTSAIYCHSVWAYFYYIDQPSMQNFQISVINTALYVTVIVGANYTAVVFLGKFLTDREYHPTESRYERNLSHKIFSFYIVDGFLWYVILAFVQIPMTGTKAMTDFVALFSIDMAQMKVLHTEEYSKLMSDDYWMALLENTVVGYFTMSQFFPLFIESVLPVLIRRLRHVKKKYLNKRARRLSHGSDVELSTLSYTNLDEEEEDEQEQDKHRSLVDKKLESDKLDDVDKMKWHIFPKNPDRAFDKLREQAKRDDLELYDDYEDMILEYGYVLVLTVLFPLVPILALGNNLLEVRADLYRMTDVSRRTCLGPANGIGVYQDHLDITTTMSVVMTLGLVMVATHDMDVYFDFFKDSSYESIVFDIEDGKPTHTKMWIRFLIAVIVEHLIFAIQKAIVTLTPAAPKWVRYEQDKAKHDLLQKLKSKRNLGFVDGE